MTIGANKDQSIEGETIGVTTRQLNVLVPRRDSTGLKYRYKTGINSKAEILFELTPKTAIVRVGSLLEKGDCVVGDTLLVECDKAIRPDIGRGSGRHSASICQARKRAFAQVVIPKRSIAEAQSLGHARR
jgi:hypothetical protein